MAVIAEWPGKHATVVCNRIGEPVRAGAKRQ